MLAKGERREEGGGGGDARIARRTGETERERCRKIAKWREKGRRNTMA